MVSIVATVYLLTLLAVGLVTKSFNGQELMVNNPKPDCVRILPGFVSLSGSMIYRYPAEKNQMAYGGINRLMFIGQP